MAAAMGGTRASHPEDRRTIEQLLRRVEDDPAGLLRQRFCCSSTCGARSATGRADEA